MGLFCKILDEQFLWVLGRKDKRKGGEYTAARVMTNDAAVEEALMSWSTCIIFFIRDTARCYDMEA